MEIVTNVIAWVTANLTTVVGAVLAILGGFSIIAKLTPTEADDKIVQFLLNIIHSLGLTKDTSGK